MLRITPTTPFAPAAATPVVTAGRGDPTTMVEDARNRLQAAGSLPPADAALEIGRAALAYLGAYVDFARPLPDEAARLRTLATLLTVQNDHQATVQMTDLNGDGMREAVISENWMGVPVIIVRSSGTELTPYTLPSADPAAACNVARIGDINGDGKLELVVTEEAGGASALNTQVSIYQAVGDSYKKLFSRGFTNWAGLAGWGLAGGDGSAGDIYIYQAYLGIHSYKLLHHQTITDTYRFQGDGYVLAGSQLSPPTVQRHYVNAAEELFLKGDYAAAAAGFKTAIDARGLPPEEGVQVNWTAYSWFRLAETYALLNNEAAARAALAEARQAGSTIGDLAVAFAQAYDGPDAAARALAAASNVDLYERLYQGKAGNLDVPVDGRVVLYPAGAVLAYLNSHSDLPGRSPAEIGKALQALGLTTPSLLAADLNGDGQNELAVMLPAGREDLRRLWVFGQVDGAWRAFGGEMGQGISLKGVTSVTGGQKKLAALVIERGAQASPREVLAIWDGRQVSSALR